MSLREERKGENGKGVWRDRERASWGLFTAEEKAEQGMKERLRLVKGDFGKIARKGSP